MHGITSGILIGIGATILMDIWSVILWKLFGKPAPNWAPVGRWVGHLQDGKVFHENIGQATPVANEQAIGWIFHYFVGAVYGIVLVLIMGESWLQAPTFLPAFIWGIVTIAGGWFLLHPGLGLGWAVSKVPNPAMARIMGLVAHTVFAIGLWGTALILR